MSGTLENSPASETNALSGEFLDKLQSIDHELREETKGVILFGVFERDDAPGRWDVLVAADWVGPDVTPAVVYVAGKIQQRLTPEELAPLAGVVALRPTDPFVRLVTGASRIDGRACLQDNTINGIPIARAWIFTANRENHSDFQPPPYVAHQQVSTKAKITTGQKSATGAKAAQRKR